MKGAVECGKSWESITPPKAGDTVRNFKLSKCISGGGFGEAWFATPSSGGQQVVLKIARSAISQDSSKDGNDGAVISKDEYIDRLTRGGNPGHVGLDLDYEYLFAKATFERDPSHYVGCSETGVWTSSGDSQHTYAAFNVVPGAPLASSENDETVSYSNVLSLWVGLGEAIKDMLSKNDEDKFKFFHLDWNKESLMVEWHRPTVTLIDYGISLICCDGDDEKTCTKSISLASGTSRDNFIFRCVPS